jgi:drug/metabolite transporter (DMT)-like permease
MSLKKDPQKILLAGIIISMFFWGLSWPSGKVLSTYCSAYNFAVYRYTVVLISFIPVLFFFKQSIRIKKQGWSSVIASAILLTLYSYLFYMGVKKGQAGAGGVLVTTLNPIMAYALGACISKKWPGRNELIGLFCGLLAGVILLEAWQHPDKILESGNLYFLFAAFSWALMSKFTSQAGLYGSSFGFSFWQYLITLCCFLPGLNTSELTNTLHISDKWFWLNLIFGSAIVTSLATSLYFYATTKLGAEKASSFIFMVPLAAALSSWLFLGEKIQLHTIVGGGIGIAAVYFINVKKTN